MAADAPDLPDSWNVEDAEVARKGPRLGLILGGVVLLALVVVGGVLGFQAAMEKTKKTWPASVEGPPDGLGGKPEEAAAEVKPGVYLWSDFGGWHLRVVNGEGVSGVSGTITSGDKIAAAEPATKGEGTVTIDQKSASFELPAEPRVVGVDFNPGFYGEKLTVSLTGADGPVDPKLVTVGRDRTVTQVPVVVEKVPADDAANR